MSLSFKLATPLGIAFKPHQALLMLTHESNLEHVFAVGNTAEKFEIENSFLQSLGHIDLELPAAPEKATRPPPPQPVDLNLRYGPKAEIYPIARPLQLVVVSCVFCSSAFSILIDNG
ncbi:hypothetical protein Dimus_022566 [Dionaea muscipula]